MGLTLAILPASATHGAIAACSGLSPGIVTQNHTVRIGGSSTPFSDAIQFTTSVVRCLHYETEPGALDGVVIPAGSWTLVVDVANTVAVQNHLVSAYICRLNSAGVSQETVASVTGLVIDCSFAGVKTVSLSSNTVTQSAGDYLYFVFGFTVLVPHQTVTLLINENQLFFTPITAAPPPLPVIGYQPLVLTGPQKAGAPWGHQLTTQQNILPAPPPPRYQPVGFTGPFIFGSPWKTPFPSPAPSGSPPSPAPIPTPIPPVYTPLILSGPAMRGAPWKSPGTAPVSSKPSVPTPLPPPAKLFIGKYLPIPYAADEDNRRERHLKIVANIFNSLLGREQIVATGIDQFMIQKAGAYVSNAAPQLTHDVTQGFFPGALYLDTTTSVVYIAISTAMNAAVWRIIPTISPLTPPLPPPPGPLPPEPIPPIP